MDTSQWISVQREDGETVGYLEPLAEDFGTVLPRNILGHAIDEPREYLQGEELLIERGIGELMNPWILDAQQGESTRELTILEISAHGIVLADALHTKALSPTSRIHVDWPDVTGRLAPAVPRASNK
ncbi:hypothetical protein [Arthrobacter sp. NIO-1057]|uniref:hypothetical protein n=1 Tax=Arthrobacter sp. NIO-1057 TaxID=993071 RepID=UPI00071C55F3|nr:hypothetical protein [Arthrobacter sp. NIO-1057]KSU66968.1 hypothetical protein AS038_04060 [Arthrobacter sp. NIO-1057]SCB93193.1 hypothetical protein GA0061084_0823 [Arthrobacter sp. NIO-1057]